MQVQPIKTCLGFRSNLRNEFPLFLISWGSRAGDSAYAKRKPSFKAAGAVVHTQFTSNLLQPVLVSSLL